MTQSNSNTLQKIQFFFHTCQNCTLFFSIEKLELNFAQTSEYCGCCISKKNYLKIYFSHTKIKIKECEFVSKNLYMEKVNFHAFLFCPIVIKFYHHSKLVDTIKIFLSEHLKLLNRKENLIIQFIDKNTITGIFKIELKNTPINNEASYFSKNDENFNRQINPKFSNKNLSTLIKYLIEAISQIGDKHIMNTKELFFCFYNLQIFYEEKIKVNSCYTSIETKDDFENLRYYWKFAVAAFGSKAIDLSQKKYKNFIFDLFCTKNENSKIFRYLNLANMEDDHNVRVYSEFEPQFFLLNMDKDLIISISGTLSIADLITDLTCEYRIVSLSDFCINSPLSEITPLGFVHSGIFAVAKKIFIVLYQLELENYNKIIITGHSLGAAIASLLSCMFFIEFKNHLNIECYSFGGPPIASLEIVNWYNNAKNSNFSILNYIYRNDIIPTLCYGSVLDLKIMCEECLKLKKDSLRTRQEVLQQKRLDIMNKNPKLYLIGKVYHYWDNEKITIYEKEPMQTEIQLKKGNFKDHFFHKYQFSLEQKALNNLNL